MKRILVLLLYLIIPYFAFAESCNCKDHGKPNNPKNQCCGEKEYDPKWSTGGNFQFSLHSGVINQVNNTLNRIPNVNISLNTVRLGYTSYKKSKCCNSELKDSGATASEGNVSMSATIANIPIYAVPSQTKKYELGEGDYISVEFQCGAYLTSNFSMGVKMGERYDQCDPGLNYLYGNLNSTSTIGVSATALAKACVYCDFLDCDLCLADFTITPATLSINVRASADIGTKDVKGSLPAGAVSLSRLVYSASLKIYNYTFGYSYTIID